ncbi:MAG: 30S ribosomal protein S2 [Patescibacteria group bacterium]|nr:30S ribosomal protein S2 [Patescibacteria group bacterium]
MKTPTIQELLKAGAHFGHKAAKWNPKMKEYVFTKKEGIYIINLSKTKEMLEKALEYVSEIAKKGGKIVFICTKRQGKDLVKKAAISCNMPYVTTRWLGGTLTNFKTIHNLIQKLRTLERKKETGEMEKNYTKYERQLMLEDIEKLNNKIGGLKNLDKLPEALLLIDVMDNKSAIKEAKVVGIPTVALVDVNGNPELINYPVPCNDDAIKIIDLMANTFAEAIKENYKEQKPAVGNVKNFSGGQNLR